MISEVYFVRHAHSVFSLENEETRELSLKGWEDAKRISDVLIKEDINYIVSSSYVRARQTVEGLAEHLQKEIEIDSRFRERDLASRDYKFNSPLEAMQYVFENPTFNYPGGESNNEVQETGIKGLKAVLHKY